ncbi:MAG: hypothetical protein WCH61_09145, partial [bacterium]
MLADLYATHTDFIYFAYGLLFLLLASICRMLHRRDADTPQLPWQWLSWFALVYGTNKWFDLVAYSIGDHTNFRILRLCLTVLAFCLLLEFGRDGLQRLGVKLPGQWLVLPLLGLAGLGSVFGQNGVEAISRYTLAFPGAIMAATAILIQARQNHKGRRWLVMAAAALALYGVTACMAVPPAGFPPATFLNHRAFQNVFGFPVQALRGLLAAAFLVGVWRYSEATLGIKLNTVLWVRRRRLVLGLPLTFLLVLVAGLVATDLVGRLTQNEMENNFLHRARTAAAAFLVSDLQQIQPTPTSEPLPAYRRIKEQVLAIRGVNLDCIFVHLVGQADGRFHFISDSKQTGTKRGFHPGDTYPEATSAMAEAFVTGNPQFEAPNGLLGDHLAALAPIRNANGG